MNTFGLRSGTGGTGETVLLIGPSVMDVGLILSANVNSSVFDMGVTEVLTMNVDSIVLSADVITEQTLEVQ